MKKSLSSILKSGLAVGLGALTMTLSSCGAPNPTPPPNPTESKLELDFYAKKGNVALYQVDSTSDFSGSVSFSDGIEPLNSDLREILISEFPEVEGKVVYIEENGTVNDVKHGDYIPVYINKEKSVEDIVLKSNTGESKKFSVETPNSNLYENYSVNLEEIVRNAFNNSDITDKQLGFAINDGSEYGERFIVFNYNPSSDAPGENNFLFFDPKTDEHIATMDLIEYNKETEDNLYDYSRTSKKILDDLGFEYEIVDNRMKINTPKLLEDAFNTMVVDDNYQGGIRMVIEDRDANFYGEPIFFLWKQKK